MGGIRGAAMALALGPLSGTIACTLLVSTEGLAGEAPSLDAATDGGPPNDAGKEGSAEASTLGGASRCALSPFITCDGFEGAGGPKWNVPPPIDTMHAARGGRAMHLALAQGDGGRQTAAVSTSESLRFPSLGVFIRGFVYVPSGQFIPDTGILWLYHDGAPFAGVDLGFAAGKLRLRAVAGSGATRVSTKAVPLDRWVCLEMEVHPNDATTGGARAWIDEQPLDDIEIPTGVVTEAPNLLQIGVEADVTSTSSGFDLWVDEVAVDLVRIGCAR